MANVITIQDEYIATMGRIPQSSGAYCVMLTKASKKAMSAMLNLGMSQEMAESALYAAHDMVRLEQR